MKKLFVPVVVLSTGFAVCAADLTARSIRLSFDEKGRGAVTRLDSTDGARFAAGKGTDLFKLGVCRRDDFAARAEVASSAAGRMTVERAPDGVKLVYEDLGEAVARVVCTIRAPADGAFIRWGISVDMKDGWALEQTDYPRLLLSARLSADGADDVIVLGLSKGGVIRNPSAEKPGWRHSAHLPGTCIAQFGCFYDPRAGFYFAAEDNQGCTKTIYVAREPEGLLFSSIRFGFATGAVTQDYDVVTGTFTGSDGEPADWYDAADIYKRWAIKQDWCSKKIRARDDLPAWLKAAPAMTRFGRDELARPDLIRRWMKEYWKKNFPDVPLITSYWGWEHDGKWISAHYLPCFPSDDAFRALLADMRKEGAHAFLWPSGYHRTKTYLKQADGSFFIDDRERSAREDAPHEVVNRDGTPYARQAEWLGGGVTGCLCGGDPWTIDWWNRALSRPLAERGAELLQVDQVVGGGFPDCWSKTHPHEPGNGLWRTEAFRRHLHMMREAMRAAQPGAVVAVEEPNELFNGIVGVQDYRDCEPFGEFASVYGYLYHEFVIPFQSNPNFFGGRRISESHAAADGQMPHALASLHDFTDCPDPIFNAGFEEANPRSDSGVLGWETIPWSFDLPPEQMKIAYNSKCAADRAEKHDGNASFRMTTRPGERGFTLQRIYTDDEVFRPGTKYRLGAWLKTGKAARQNAVRCELLTSADKAVLNRPLPGVPAVELPFPPSGAGWKRVTADFTLDGDTEMIRILIAVTDEACVWADDLTLEEVAADSTAAPVKLTGRSSHAAFMKAWIRLYHGEGREWLAFGRQIRPPRLECASRTIRGQRVPCVFAGAFEAQDGRRATVLANSTPEEQPVTLERKGVKRPFVLKPDELRLIQEDEGLYVGKTEKMDEF